MGLLVDSGPKLRDEEFRLLRDHVNRFCGIYFPDEARYVLERRLRERIAALSMKSFAEYYHFLRYEDGAGAELEHAADVLTTNETYFFREEYQLRGFVDEVLPRVREAGEQSGTKRLSLWSAGCSTGEEAYTLAILVLDSGLFTGWDIRIFGNDISRRVLKTARRGVYGASSFRAMPKRYERYFVETGEGMQVHPKVRALCNFGHFNLLDAARSGIVGRVDAVFCRNVLIYFDGESRRRVIQSFYDRLAHGGYLFLGHSESLLNVSTAFELVHLRSDLVYRKPVVQAQVDGRDEKR